MAEYRFTIYCQSGAYGWTETYGDDGYTQPPTVAAVDPVLQARARLLGAGARLTAVRFWSPVPFDRVYWSYPLLGNTYAAPDGAPQCDRPYQALLWRMSDATGHHSTRYMRGLPDAYITGNPAVPNGWEPVDPWPTYWFAFRAALTAGIGWHVVKINRDPNTGAYLGYTSTFRRCTQVGHIRATSRATGRPTGGPVGRRWAHRRNLSRPLAV
jgi:hypothetical protein